MEEVFQLKAVINQQQSQLHHQQLLLGKQRELVEAKSQEVSQLETERESLTGEVRDLQGKLCEREREREEGVKQVRVARELTEKLRREVRDRDDIIEEMKGRVVSLETTVSQLQPTKKHSFPRIPMPKLSLLRSASSPDVHQRNVATATASRRRSPYRSESDRLCPSPLSPLLELSTQLETTDEGVFEEVDSSGAETGVFELLNASRSSGATNDSRSLGATNGNSPGASPSNETLTSSDCSSISPVAKDETVDISDLRWREGRKAPEKMARGSAAVRGNTAYFRPAGSHKIYSCTLTSGKVNWSNLPDGKSLNFGLVVIGDQLTSVGGQMLTGDYSTTSEILSISLSGRKRCQWCVVLPPMPTARCNAAAVAVGDAILVVAGGYDRGRELDGVEVLDLANRTWCSVPRLPRRLSNLVSVVSGGYLYLGGGFEGQPSNSVFCCSLESFGTSSENGGLTSPLPEGGGREGGEESEFWRTVSGLPVTNSSIVEFSGNLLSVGGTSVATNTTTNSVYQYNPLSGQWVDVCVIKNKRERCFAVAVVSPRKLLIVGGVLANGSKTDHVEVADVPHFTP